MEFEKLQSLQVTFDLFSRFKLEWLPDSIVDLSQLKTFRLWQCHKFENVPMEFEKLQSLQVAFDLFSRFKLEWLPNSIVDLSQLKTFHVTTLL
jgi:hypothetical protein